MATNITTDNLRTADTLEALGAGTESGSFLICGKGSKLYQLPFERLRQNVNSGVIIPVKTEDKAIYNELFIASEIVSIEEKLFNDFSINVDFSKDGNIVVMNNTAYLLNASGIPYKVDLTNNTVERLSDNSFMAVIACRDYALFIHRYGFVSSTFGVNIYTGEIIHAADTVDTSLESMITSATLTRVHAFNYPYDIYNGVMMYDNATTYTYIYFSCNSNGWTFEIKSEDFAEVEAETGEKVQDVQIAIEERNIGDKNSLQLAIIGVNDGDFVVSGSLSGFKETSETLNFEGMKLMLALYNTYSSDNIEIECMFVSKEKLIIVNMVNFNIQEYNFYFDENIKNKVLAVQHFHNYCFFALQETNKTNTYAIVKYELIPNGSESVQLETSVVKTIQTTMQVQNFVLDPISMQQYIDGTIYEPSIMLVGVCDNYGSLGVSHYETTYKQTLKIKLADGVKALTD